MVPYVQTIPGTAVKFRMTPIPGGVVTLGLPSPGHNAAPQNRSLSGLQVKVSPRWVGVHEVTWAEYRPFMQLYDTFSRIGFLRGELYNGAPKLEAELLKFPELKHAIDAEESYVDGVTAPTPLYDDTIAHRSGQHPNLPAVSMTLYAARQYTKWLSVLTGQHYRLMSEAEWEHAARAGAAGELTADDALDDFAWHKVNSGGKTRPVGLKKPNAWGLHDVLGNAAELVLDATSSEPPKTQPPLAWRDAMPKPVRDTPRIAKGGFCGADPDDCRSSARMLSIDEEVNEDDDWKYSDPNEPKSPWWFADIPSHGIGFRIARPLAAMDEQAKALVWEIDTEDLKTDVAARLRGGNGELQMINKDFPRVVEQLESREIRKLLE